MNKKEIIALLIIVFIIIVGIWSVDKIRSNKQTDIVADKNQNLGQEKVLKQELATLNHDYDSVQTLINVLQQKLSSFKKDTVIVQMYTHEKDSIIHLSVDRKVKYIADRLPR